MNKGKLASFVGAGLLLACASGCAVPMVLIDQAFLGETRTAKMVIRRNPEGNFTQILRVCTLDQGGQETACKDTVVLDNVVAASLY
ncbi:MAG: hypothetical protein HY908_26065 [Myxococcales bacterium]|nr:hypothetical protein [Myxococcales bacterium]